MVCLGASNNKESACNVGGIDLIPGSKKIPWRRKWQSAPVVLPGKSCEQKSLVDYSPWDRKELNRTEKLTLSLSLSSLNYIIGQLFLTI